MLIRLAVEWTVVSGVFMAAASALPDVRVKKVGGALAAAAVFGVVQALLGWLLAPIFKAILFLPAVLTLGLAWLLVPLIINMVLLKVADHLVGDSLEIRGLRALMTLALTIAIALAVTRGVFRLLA